MQVRAYDAAVALELLRSLRQELIIAGPVKIRQQSALEEAQKHEREKRNMTVLKASRCPMTPIRKSSKQKR